MGRPEALCRDENSYSLDDDLGKAVRWSLEDAVAGAEPSPDVWRRISVRVHEMHAPKTVKRRIQLSLLPLGSIAQVVVIGMLLFSFGLGIERSHVPTSSYPAYPTPTIQKSKVQAKQLDDMLRGYMLARKEPESPLHHRERNAEVDLLQ